MGIPTELTLFLKQCSGAENFVETGTFKGTTAVWASQFFDNVATIEMSEPIYQETRNRHQHITNIEFFLGHTVERLKQILSNLNGPTIFWLDAHWSGANTYGINDECPLIEEIRIINDSGIDSIILIDDARLFLSPPPLPHKIEAWPDLPSIIYQLENISKKYIAVLDDCIISVPEKLKDPLSGYCQKIADNDLIQERSGAVNIKKGLINIKNGLRLLIR